MPRLDSAGLSVFGSKRSRRRRRNCRDWRRSRLFEQLEPRLPLATITVTDLNDGPLAALAGDGEISLREAIEAANTNQSVDGSPAGESARRDTIEFASGVSGTIALRGGLLKITESLVIDGGPSVQGITLNGGGGGFNALEISAENVTLRDLHFTNAAHGIYVTGNSAVRLRDVTANGNSGDGVHIEDATSNAVNSLTNVTASNNGGSGIFIENLVSSDRLDFDSVTASNNGGSGIFIDDFIGSDRLEFDSVTANGNVSGGVTLSRVTGVDSIELDSVDAEGNSKGIEISNSEAAVTILNTGVIGNLDDGLRVTNVTGTLLLSAINGSGNGVNVSGSGAGAHIAQIEGDVTVFVGDFNDQHDGLRVRFVTGNVVILDITADANDGTGLDVLGITGDFGVRGDFRQNTQGIAINSISGTVNVTATTASDNDNTGLRVTSAGSSVSINSGVYSNNGQWGISQILSGSTTLTDVVAEGNSLSGLLVSEAPELRVSGGSFSSNGRWGIDADASEVFVDDAQVIGNSVFDAGDHGGMRLRNASNFMSSSTNFSTNAGRGLDLRTISATELHDVAIQDNLGRGLTIDQTNDVLIQNAVISGNEGGIDHEGLLLRVVNSTISDNTTEFLGGGISHRSGQLILEHSTIAGNSSEVSGGGIWVSDSFPQPQPPRLFNTIVALNNADFGEANVNRALDLNSDFNLIGSGQSTGLAGVGSNQVGSDANPIDPLLAPLGDYGGGAQTRALLAGSPAIDSGDLEGNVTEPNDQRGVGFPRVVGDRVDVGAYEYNPLVVTTTEDVIGAPGAVSLREAIATANASATPETISFSETLSGTPIVLTQGELAISNSMTIAGFGASQLTISGNDQSRIFQIDDGSTNSQIDVEIRGINLADGNAGNANGGAVLLRENLTLDAVALTDNQASRGGGLWSNTDLGAVLEIQDSTFSGNSASSEGGGIWWEARNNTSVTILSSTVSGNTAGVGGGILSRVVGSGAAEIVNSTISRNTSTGDGGGLRATLIAPDVQNTIIAENSSSGGGHTDVSGSITSQFNLIGDNTGSGLAEAPLGSPDASGNLIGGPVNGIIDPLLGPLAGGGSQTATHALISGSPAQNMGSSALANNAGLTEDQRGQPRFIGRVDIGAFEYLSVDSDGVDDGVEAGAPNNGDGNYDGDPDSQQDNVASLPDADGDAYLTIYTSSNSGTTLENVAVTRDPLDIAQPPPGIEFPLGFAQFEVTGVPSFFDTVSVFIRVDPPQIIDSYYKFDGTDFIPFPAICGTLLQIPPFPCQDNLGVPVDFIRLNLTDGGPGDLDGVENGTIVDPGAASINPVPKVETIDGPDLGVPGQPLSFSAEFFDSASDSHTASIDWGDGQSEAVAAETVNGFGTVAATHHYQIPGSYNVTMTVVDFAGQTGIVSKTVVVQQVATFSDPENPGEAVLAVGGTSIADQIFFAPSENGVTVSLNGSVIGDFSNNQFDRLAAYGQQGNDFISVDGSLTYASDLHGGDGDDVVLGSGGDDRIDGGAGNDFIAAGAGNNTIAELVGTGYVPAATEVVQSFAVTELADSGPGSLREALTSANAVNATGVIDFQLALNPGDTLDVASQLPALDNSNHPIIINGHTASAFAGGTIVLDGSSTAPGTDGIVSLSDGNHIVGVNIRNFGGDGIDVRSGVGAVIADNYIGTDETGSTGMGNAGNGVFVQGGSNAANVRIIDNVVSDNGGRGIYVRGPGHVIQGNTIGTSADGMNALGNGREGIWLLSAVNTLVGGPDEGDRNLISGNGRSGIRMQETNGGNLIQNNYVGLNADGTAAIPNARRGIFVGLETFNNEIRGNVIGGHAGFAGIEFISGFGETIENNVVAGNWIGLVPVESGAPRLLPNAFGITLRDDVFNNTIGGSGLEDANVIAAGILGVRMIGASENQVVGNFIGTDPFGSTGLGAGIGIDLSDGASENDIRDNVISGNSIGVRIRRFESDALSQGNIIQGNTIGLSPDGASPLPNTQIAILLDENSRSTLVGGTGLGEANVIAFNGGSGIAVTHALSTGHTFRGNSIHSNGGLEIDLGGDGVTFNDPLDVDAGANNLQNFGRIFSVASGAATNVVGEFRGEANAAVTLDFYASTAADLSGYGGGERYLDSIVVTTNANGIATFDVTLAAPTVPSDLISMTATGPGGNTSEFSRAVSQLVPSPSLAINGSFELGAPLPGWTANEAEWRTDLAASGGVASAHLNDAGSGVAGSLQQTVPTVAGQTYLVTFDLAGDPFADQGVKQIHVSAAGDSAEYSFDTTGHTRSVMGWQSESFTFTATSTTTTLLFVSLTASTYGPAVDNVQVEVAIDGNDDGVIDGLQSNVSSQPDAVTGSNVTVESPAGTGLTDVVASQDPSPGITPPDDVDFPIGFVEFNVAGVAVGGTIEVTLYPETPQPLNVYYKFDGTSFVEFAGATFIDSNADGFVEAIRLSLTDGGAGDLDNTANGVIVDPGGPAFNPPATVDPIVGPDAGVTQQPLSFTASFNDLGGDSHTAVVDWGDGLTESLGVDQTAGGGSVSAMHAYDRPGQYTVRIELTDEVGNVSNEEKAVTISQLLLVDDPGDPDKQSLAVGGTPSGDHIKIQAVDYGNVIEVRLNDRGLGRFDTATLSGLLAFGGQGRDHIVVGPGFSLPTELYGGDGSDTIHGGDGPDRIFGESGHDTIVAGLGDDFIDAGSGYDAVWAGAGNDIAVGGTGNDLLFGGIGRDLLIGGAGRDLIFGSFGDDLLIGGSTTFDDDIASLALIQREWTSERGFVDRVQNLENGSGPLLDGTGIKLELGSTVSDQERDLLFGGLGEDWKLDA